LIIPILERLESVELPFQLVAGMKISTGKTEVMAFKRKEHILSKICVYDKPKQQVSSFKYLGYNIYEKDADISTKILNYNRVMGIINQIFKSTLVHKHTRIKIYKTLSRPILTYGSEAWTVCKSDITRIIVNEMKFLRRTAGYTKLDKKRNTEILRELKINSALEHVDQYRNNWKQRAKNGPESCSLTNDDLSSERQKIPWKTP
jgi:hypothetical protein